MSHFTKRIVVPSGAYSMLFDGVDEYVSIANETDFDFQHNNAFTLSAWIKPSIPQSFSRIIAKDPEGAGGLDRGYSLYVNGNVLECQIRNNGTTRIRVQSITTLTDGVWQFVQLKYTGSGIASGVTFKIDAVDAGANVLQDNLSGNSILNDVKLAIGDTNGDGVGVRAPFTGNIDEVGIFNYHTSNAEDTEIYNSGVPIDLVNTYSGTSPIGWWRMGEQASYDGTNWTLVDQGTGANNGTSVNMELTDRVTDVP